MIKNNLKFELILPCYNESKSLEKIIRNCIDVANKYNFNSDEFKLILVENGSKDNSKEILEKFENFELFKNWIKVVYIDINQGYGFGIYKGLCETSAPVVGWSHADEQCDIEDAFKALEKFELLNIDQKNIFIKGKRVSRNIKDVFISRVFEFLAYLILGIKINEINAQPKLFHRQLLNKIINPPKDFSFDLYVLYIAQKNKYIFESIQVNFPPRVHGFSNWSSNFLLKYKTIFKMIKTLFRILFSEGRA